MVESTAYYEAYRHVLEGLRELSLIPDVMPMEKYIVSCDVKNPGVPQFLRIPSHRPRFNMADVLEKKIPGTRSRLTRKVFDITDHLLWPPAECTHLDSSQLKALEMALTKDVSVIQGPPGTGKTYIGHKIVEAYLKNRVVLGSSEKQLPFLSYATPTMPSINSWRAFESSQLAQRKIIPTSSELVGGAKAKSWQTLC